MSNAASLTLDALAAGEYGPLPRYSVLLTDTFDEHPPPFGNASYGDSFREHARDPNWLAATLAQNATVEGDGARKLADLVSRLAEPSLRDLVWQHAVDESNHARYYVTMLELVFPAIDADSQSLELLHDASPRFHFRQPPAPTELSTDTVVFDELIQMNIGEIRTRIHHCLFTSVLLAIVPSGNQARLERILATILTDETRHIAYTAQLIDAKIVDERWRAWATERFSERARQFNELTLEQVGSI